jgi:hypothetical protein
VKLKNIISVCFVLFGLLSSGIFLNDGWLDEPRTPEKDSLVVEETETTQEFREEGRIKIGVLTEIKEAKSSLVIRQQIFASELSAKFERYQQKIRSDEPPDDFQVVFASFLI